MKEYFSQYGTITDIVRMKDKETGNLIHYVKRDFNIEKQLPCCLYNKPNVYHTTFMQPK